MDDIEDFNINRIKVEFKDFSFAFSPLKALYINRIKVEFKEDQIEQMLGEMGNINRIKVEFKVSLNCALLSRTYPY
ncbi:unknown [Firmicutes bacterium CAG:227]|nr:unknown [Firmicutes bacterium CAG:227]